MKRLALIAFTAGLTLSSCSSDDAQLPIENTLVVPQNYTFERGSATTVNYEGQTTRLQMSAEILSSFTDFENTTAESLSNMFSNENSPFASAALNESSKSVKSKVAASSLYFSSNTVESTEIKADFEAFIEEQMTVVKANKNKLAEPGVAGQIADGSEVRYVSEKGLVLNQTFAKGLIGAWITDQVLNHYLTLSVLDQGTNRDANNSGITEEGENYTNMEHFWDEAYGYLYGDTSIPSQDPNSVLNNSEDRLLFNYLGQVDQDSDFEGIAKSTFEAFKTGRAAIVAGDYELRDEQVSIISSNLSKVIGVRSVRYLQNAKKAFEDNNKGRAFNQLSEGFGFVYSLRFTHKPSTNLPYLTNSQIEGFKADLLAGNGFWDVTPETLDSISEEIATAFGFTVAQAAE